MERSVTHPSDRGFSLLELVVVVAIMAVLSVTAVLSLGRAGPEKGSDLARFEASYARQQDAAIYSRSARAMTVSPEGWQVLTRKADANGALQWQPAGRLHHFRGPVQVTLKRIKLPGQAADIIFLPDGQATLFRATFGQTGAAQSCSGTRWAGLVCDN